MTSPFLRSIRRTLGAAAGIASLLGPAVAQAADCIDFDGNHRCAPQGERSDVPIVRGTPVDTSSGTYHAPPSLPPSDRKGNDTKKNDPPPPPKTPERKYVQH